MREELEAVKKALAETLEASPAAEEDKYPDRTVPVEDVYDSSGDTYGLPEPERSYMLRYGIVMEDSATVCGHIITIAGSKSGIRPGWGYLRAGIINLLDELF